jgi:hypothetical protein
MQGVAKIVVYRMRIINIQSKFLSQVRSMHSIEYITSTTSNVRPFPGGFPIRMGKTNRSGMFRGARFYAKYTDALQAKCEGQIIVDMERIGVAIDSNTRQKRLTTFGRVYAPLSHHELQSLMMSLHNSDRHLYESLADNAPTKLVLDIDRALPSHTTHADVQHLDEILETHFLPLLCAILNDLIMLPSRAAITPADFLVLDASLAAYKYSKHLIMNTSPQIACSPRRDIEKVVMAAFRERMQDVCLRDATLREFCYFQTEGDHDTKEAVDFNIYSSGKRSMRLPGCCKGDGKHANKPLRLLMPDLRFCRPNVPFTTFMCNTSPTQGEVVTWVSRTPLASLMPRAARHIPSAQTAGVPSVSRISGNCDSIPTHISECVQWIASAVHPHFTSRSMSTDVSPTGIQSVTMMINYKAASADVDRTCAFGCEKHSRHYASVSLHDDGSSDYFCFGCQETTVLRAPTATSSNNVITPESTPSQDFVGLITRYLPGCTMTQVCTQFLPSCPLMDDLSVPEMCIARSGMGTGKTYMIADYIQRLSAIRPELRVVSIGFRQTLNTALATRLQLQNYLTSEAASLHGVPRVSIQLDSLARLLVPGGEDGLFLLPSAYDVVIIDEVESLLTHFTSATMQDKALLCWRIFECILCQCSKLVVCDADLGDRSLAFISGLGRDHKHTHVLCNTFASHTTEHVVVHNVVTFTKRLFRHAVKQKRKVYLASNSKTYAHHAQSILVAAGLHVLLIEGASPPAVKAAAAECDRTWGTYDVVVCTPAVAAGIDCSIHHFDDVFVYGTNGSNTGRELNQQRGRVRHIRSRTVYVCIDKVRKTYGPGSIDPPSQAIVAASMAKMVGGVRSLFDDIRACVLPSVADEPGALGIRVTQCPEALLRIIAVSRMERNRSVSNMTLEYERAVTWADEKAVIKKLPPTALRYISMLNMEIHNLHIAQHEAQEICRAVYAPSCAMDAGMVDPLIYQKAKLGNFFGGIDFQCTDAVFHFLPASRQSTIKNTWESLLPISYLFMADQTAGGAFSTRTLKDLQTHVSKTVHHKIVLEDQLPSWVTRIFTVILMFAAGCSGVSVVMASENGVSVIPDSNIVATVVRDGLCASLAQMRLQDIHLQAWLRRQAHNFIGYEGDGVQVEVFDARATIKITRQWLTQTYGLKWGKCTVKRTRGADGVILRHPKCHPRNDLLRLSILGVCLHAHTYDTDIRDAAHAYQDDCMLKLGVRSDEKDYLTNEIFLADYDIAIPSITELKRRTACKVGLAAEKTSAPVDPLTDGIGSALEGWAAVDSARVMADVGGILACLHIPASS